jgi:15-cis-phytoene synthase
MRDQLPSQYRPDDIAYVTGLVRAQDRPRYYATLFAPATIRDDLFALYGFAAEIARIPDLVSEPALGEIRLRWWNDALSGTAGGRGDSATPALRALSSTIATHRLPLAPFEALIEARMPDLYSDPPATVGDLEGRLGEMESALFQMAAIIAGGVGREAADAAGHAGVAYGIARRLAAFASDRGRGRTIVPTEILERAGMSPADLFASKQPQRTAKAVAELVEVARRHLAEARTRIPGLPKPVQTIFLPLAIVAPLLGKIESIGGAIGEREARLSDLESLLRIGWARLRWRRGESDER